MGAFSGQKEEEERHCLHGGTERHFPPREQGVGYSKVANSPSFSAALDDQNQQIWLRPNDPQGECGPDQALRTQCMSDPITAMAIWSGGLTEDDPGQEALIVATSPTDATNFHPLLHFFLLPDLSLIHEDPQEELQPTMRLALPRTPLFPASEAKGMAGVGSVGQAASVTALRCCGPLLLIGTSYGSVAAGSIAVVREMMGLALSVQARESSAVEALKLHLAPPQPPEEPTRPPPSRLSPARLFSILPSISFGGKAESEDSEWESDVAEFRCDLVCGDDMGAYSARVGEWREARAAKDGRMDVFTPPFVSFNPGLEGAGEDSAVRSLHGLQLEEESSGEWDEWYLAAGFQCGKVAVFWIRDEKLSPTTLKLSHTKRGTLAGECKVKQLVWQKHGSNHPCLWVTTESNGHSDCLHRIKPTNRDEPEEWMSVTYPDCSDPTLHQPPNNIQTISDILLEDSGKDSYAMFWTESKPDPSTLATPGQSRRSSVLYAWSINKSKGSCVVFRYFCIPNQGDSSILHACIPGPVTMEDSSEGLSRPCFRIRATNSEGAASTYICGTPSYMKWEEVAGDVKRAVLDPGSLSSGACTRDAVFNFIWEQKGYQQLHEAARLLGSTEDTDGGSSAGGDGSLTETLHVGQRGLGVGAREEMVNWVKDAIGGTFQAITVAEGRVLEALEEGGEGCELAKEAFDTISRLRVDLNHLRNLCIELAGRGIGGESTAAPVTQGEGGQEDPLGGPPAKRICTSAGIAPLHPTQKPPRFSAILMVTERALLRLSMLDFLTQGGTTPPDSDLQRASKQRMERRRSKQPGGNQQSILRSFEESLRTISGSEDWKESRLRSSGMFDVLEVVTKKLTIDLLWSAWRQEKSRMACTPVNPVQEGVGEACETFRRVSAPAICDPVNLRPPTYGIIPKQPERQAPETDLRLVEEFTAERAADALDLCLDWNSVGTDLELETGFEKIQSKYDTGLLIALYCLQELTLLREQEANLGDFYVPIPSSVCTETDFGRWERLERRWEGVQDTLGSMESTINSQTGSTLRLLQTAWTLHLIDNLRNDDRNPAYLLELVRGRGLGMRLPEGNGLRVVLWGAMGSCVLSDQTGTACLISREARAGQAGTASAVSEQRWMWENRMLWTFIEAHCNSGFHVPPSLSSLDRGLNPGSAALSRLMEFGKQPSCVSENADRATVALVLHGVIHYASNQARRWASGMEGGVDEGNWGGPIRKAEEARAVASTTDCHPLAWFKLATMELRLREWILDFLSVFLGKAAGQMRNRFDIAVAEWLRDHLNKMIIIRP